MNVLGWLSMKENYIELYEKYRDLYMVTKKELDELAIAFNSLVKKYNELLKKSEVNSGK